MSALLLDELRFRGLLHQTTGDEALTAHLASGRRRGYAGFDPTADSLTIGNLVPITLLRHFQLAGHTPYVVMGGGTGLIGDPSGKEAERQLRTREEVEGYVAAQRRIFEQLLDFSPGVSNAAAIFNNLDWLGRLGYIELLRDVGKHFSVNMMVQKESIRERLHNREQGISYTEFSYMILQAYDFLHLFREHGVTLQIGGSDQWGNIVAGVDLIRRDNERRAFEAVPWKGAVKGPVYPEEEPFGKAFGLTNPLVTKADGGKFGKTESGAIWLTADRTSPYAFYQFWLNTADADIPRFLRLFTLLPHEEIESLEAAHAANPGAREAHRALARHVTERLHGPTERDNAEAAARALFSGEVSHLPLATLREVFGAAPSSTHSRGLLEGPGVALLDVLAQTTLATSKGQARQHLAEGSIFVNGYKAAPDARLSVGSLLHGELILLRRGKKTWHVTRWE
jgi:tyrosyl-tRNA synthetase